MKQIVHGVYHKPTLFSIAIKQLILYNEMRKIKSYRQVIIIKNIYEKSRQKHGESLFYMAATETGDMLSVSGPDMELFAGEVINESGETYKICPLTVKNSKVIRDLFEFTRPQSHKGHNITIGLGDRLGLASAGHIRLLENYDVFPVLAQQSIRELNLTGRTYEDVLAAAVWSVFREGYTKGYGADGDHLKTHEEVQYAIDRGFTMITLDCSEHFPNGLEAVIKFATEIYYRHIRGKKIDFELSIDETQTTTTPEDHLFITEELKKAGVEVVSVAPRFVGEFQKGIDYIGDVDEFEKDFRVHAEIADKFGYKISVHSGSDKFSVFPIIGKLTNGRYHLKTAGTNWLEAVRVIASKNPGLYREMHTFALENLSEARKYYHITCDLSKIVDLASTPDSNLPAYMDENNARQVLHITYGLILQAKNPDGSFTFRDRIYDTLKVHEADYMAALEKHIGRHLTELGVKPNK